MTSPYSSAPEPGTPGSPAAPGPAYTPATGGSKTLAIVSLILGIVSLLGFLFLPILFILAAIAAVILGFMSRKREPGARGMAMAGIILGFVGIAVNIASMIIGALIIASLMNGGGM